MRQAKVTMPPASPGPNSRKFPVYWPGDDWTTPETSTRDTLQPVPEEEASMEAEQGEIVFVPDVQGLPATYKVGGNRHSQGGTPLNVPDQSFVFSDTNDLKLKGPILKHFGKSEKTKKRYTPADLAKQYNLNKYRKTLADPDSDDYQRKTAEMMIANYNKKLGMLGLVQESTKGFPDGIPMVAMPYLVTAAVEPESVLPLKGIPGQSQPGEQSMMKYGGNAFQNSPTGGGFWQYGGQDNTYTAPPYMEQPMYLPGTPEHAAAGLKPSLKDYKKYLKQQGELEAPWYLPAAVGTGVALAPTMGRIAQNYLGPAGLKAIEATGKGFVKAWQKGIVPGAKYTGKKIAQAVTKANKITPLPEKVFIPAGIASGSIVSYYNRPEDNITVPTMPDLSYEMPSDRTEYVTRNTTNNIPEYTQQQVDSMFPETSPVNIDSIAKSRGFKQYGGSLPKAQSGTQVEERPDGKGNIVLWVNGKNTGKTKPDPNFKSKSAARPSRTIPGVSPVEPTAFDASQLEEAYKGVEALLTTDQAFTDDLYARWKVKNPDMNVPKERFVNNLINAQKQVFKIQARLKTDDKLRKEWDRPGKKNSNEMYNKVAATLGMPPLSQEDIMMFQGAYRELSDMEKDGAHPEVFKKFKVAPVGKKDQVYNDKAISPVDGIFGDTTLGQAFVATDQVKVEPGTKKKAGDLYPNVARYRRANIDAPWWLQDVVKTTGSAADFLRLKKYLPWAPKVSPYVPEATFYDPTRELASNTEQMQIGTQGVSTFAGPQQFNARFSGIQGEGAKNAADILGKYNNLNVGISNQANAMKADAFNKANEFNAKTAIDLYNKTTIANQQFDNAKNMARQELRQNYIDAVTNRAQAQVVNSLYPDYYFDPATGGTGIWFDERTRPNFFPDARFNSLSGPNGEDWVSAHKNMTEEEKRAWDVYNNMQGPRGELMDARTERLRNMMRSYPGARGSAGPYS